MSGLLYSHSQLSPLAEDGPLQHLQHSTNIAVTQHSANISSIIIDTQPAASSTDNRRGLTSLTDNRQLPIPQAMQDTNMRKRN